MDLDQIVSNFNILIFCNSCQAENSYGHKPPNVFCSKTFGRSLYFIWKGRKIEINLFYYTCVCINVYLQVYIY